jgi:hypothetical protein
MNTLELALEPPLIQVVVVRIELQLVQAARIAVELVVFEVVQTAELQISPEAKRQICLHWRLAQLCLLPSLLVPLP